MQKIVLGFSLIVLVSGCASNMTDAERRQWAAGMSAMSEAMGGAATAPRYYAPRPTRPPISDAPATLQAPILATPTPEYERPRQYEREYPRENQRQYPRDYPTQY